MKMQEKVSFTITNPFAQAWTGGQEEAGTGLNVQFTIQNLNKKEIVLKEFFFRGRKTTIEDIATDNNGLYIARFVNTVEKDIVLHKNHKKEAGNEPPKVQQDFPFTLANDEAVISYEENGTLNYYKLKNIVDKFPLYYPSAPPNRQ